MIPQRIEVEGFLCYREKQEITFDSAALWLLAGLNGSGKSAVFDGVTYALFGGHRAGKEHAEELINKGCDRAAVEFDFLLDGKLHRARGMLKRKKQGGTTPTQQISRWEVGPDGSTGRWQAIPDTTNKRDFDRWVQENVGLTYETFTSSVLLMQGKAEKLLSAAPKERFEVLASIVDLERYQRLHERADEERRRLKEQVELLDQELARLAEVTDAELEEAELNIHDAEAALAKAQAEVERLQRLEMQAEQWRDLQAKLTTARQQCERSQHLLADADTIERNAARLRDLVAVVPQLRALLDQRARLALVLETSERLVTEQRTLADRLGLITTAYDEKRRQRDLIQQATNEAQQREQAVGTELRELSALLACVNLCEQQRRELTRLDAALAQLPADIVALLDQARKEFERLTALAQAVPFLSRFRGEREDLRQAERVDRTTLIELESLQKEGEALNNGIALLHQQWTLASEHRRAADERATAARTLLTHAQVQLSELDELKGAKVCKHCGQALTAEHIEDERVRRRKALARAEADSQAAEQARVAAVKEEERLAREKQQKEQARDEKRERYRECRQRQQEALRDAERCGRECLRLYHEVAEPFRIHIAAQQVAEWQTTVFPGKDDIALLEKEVRGQSDTQRRLQDAQDNHDRWRQLSVERDTTKRALDAQEAMLPGDLDGLRRRNADLEAEDAQLKASLQAHRAEAKTLQEALESLEREQRTVREQLADKDRQWSAEEVRREEFQKALERVLAALPASWQSTAETLTAEHLQQWQQEQQKLQAAGVEAKAEELALVRSSLDTLRQRVVELEAEAEKVPPDARCDPAEVERRRQFARQDQAKHESALLRARQEKERLTERRDRRRQLSQERASHDLEHNHARLLAELLGRNRLQLHLVRQAERGIVDYANAVLDRLSGGQLYLRLRGSDDEGGSEQALQLEAYNRSTGQAPIGVAFLSGSQRFRVAVSLALGIGQYASRQHRPIESVIIDEGFGCLDRQGRQVMIQELQNLRGQLRCILLVSHQEEFAEAFADGYHFTLNDGSTKVTRFQR